MFGENLQKLRKENNISQEQLAEKLGVTRQSVSKWESGTSYPEMDKIVSLCKIFNCDIDTLINKDIMEEKNKKDATKVIKNFFKEIASYIEKTTRLFEQKNFKEIIRIIAQIILILIVILLFNIPFEIIKEIICNLFNTNNYYVTNFFMNFWEFLFDTAYAILAIIAFFYIFKLKFLDEIEDIKEDNIPLEKKIEEIEDIKDENKASKKDSPKRVKSSSNSIIDILVKLITIGVKFCLLLLLLPIIFGVVSLIVCIVFAIILIFKKVFIIGPTIALLAATILGITIIELILNFVFNLKINKKRTIITIITSLVLGAIGIGLSIWYFMNLTIINDSPKNYKEQFIEEKFPMTDDFKFHHIYDDIEYIADESLKNDVLVKVEYNDNYCKNLSLKKEYDTYLIKCDPTHLINGRKIVNTVIDNLKNHKLYTYSNYNTIKFTVKTSQTNIDKIIKNQNDRYNDYDDDYLEEDDFE